MRNGEVFVVVAALILLAGCGGGGAAPGRGFSPSTVAVSVSVTPVGITVTTNGTVQFAASVAGATNTTVTWSVVSGGGTISNAGLYTAPASAGTATVTATSVANPTASALANVTILAPASGSGTVPGQHSVTLNWQASTSVVAGYNVYRGAATGGPYTVLNSALVPSTAYVDFTVQSGQTYYYVVTAVDASGLESGHSNETIAAIPTP